MNELTEGRKVFAIHFAPDPNVHVSLMTEVQKGIFVKDMYITLEAGEYALVPWVMVELTNGDIELFNCANLLGIKLEKEE